LIDFFKELVNHENEDIADKSEQEENDSDNLGPLVQERIEGTSLTLTEIRISAAGNSTGEISLMAFLQKNNSDNGDGENKENNACDPDDGGHYIFLQTEIIINMLKYYNILKIILQVLFE